MAKQIEGVYEKVFECAKQEFLKKGFKDASLRIIAKNAGTSTGSIYTRFHNKEGLFDAIVSPVVEKFKIRLYNSQEDFHKKNAEIQEKILYDYSSKEIEKMVNYIYDNFNVFKLLLHCSYGTVFVDFLNELVELEVEYTLKYMESIKNIAIKKGIITKEFIHIIVSSYYSGIFEVVLHDMEKEEGMRYIMQLREFYYAGFKTIFNRKK